MELRAQSPEEVSARTGSSDPSTGIFVRAQNSDGKWDSVDIACLDAKSLLEWLRSRGGNNPWAENVVGILLGHGSLVAAKEEEGA